MARPTKSKAAPASKKQVVESSGDEDPEERQHVPQTSSKGKGRAVKQEEPDSDQSESDSDGEVETAPQRLQHPIRTSSDAEEPSNASSSSSSRASTPGPSTPVPDEPETMSSPAKISVAVPKVAPVVIAEEDSTPKQRLVIHKLVLCDFKSYAGRQVIGPFHKSFSSIVGPNGSGKSNTIDALLFVFGFKATKMRQAKLSELIHNSEGRDDLPQCSVEIWFREIIDLPGPDAYEVVPGSTLVVARTAYRNNSSKYTINGKTATYGEVQTLLKARGIDLDHKRFLILQGEVESIAQMKPMSPNEHEDGLLEYLEDIIGTSRYKEPIQQGQAEVDRLNEDRLEKTNRVKLVEREKAALEAAKKEADGYLKDQNELTKRRNELFQVYAMRYTGLIAGAQSHVDKATAELQKERDSQAGIRNEVEVLETDYKALAADHAELDKNTKEVSKQMIAFEKEDVQLQEKLKHANAKQKKTTKAITDDSHARSEAKTSFKSYSEDIVKLKAELEKHEVNLAREEAELEKICDSLKDKTAGFSQQIDVKQAELQPWLDKIAQKKGEVDIATNQRNLLREKAENIQRGIQEAKQTLDTVENENGDKVARMQELIQEQQTIKEDLAAHAKDLEKLNAQDQKLRAAAGSARSKAEDAKSNQQASQSRGDVLQSLTKLRDQGRLNGFHGRLGSLGRIDDKYDVAISTACAALDNLVCDNVAAGQACLDHLRSHTLGRATILCLDALAKRDLARIDTPENAPRLFDLVTPKDAKYAPAFYHVLQNTLVANDLTQANRIAFGQKRWRVVTLDGKLIDTSGTMSGGGARPAKGGMSSKFAADEDVSPDATARLERDVVKANDALSTCTIAKHDKEKEVEELKRKLPDLELQVSKLEMALRADKQRMDEAKRRIKELESQNRPQADDTQQIAAFDKTIKKLTDEMWSLEEKRDRIQTDIQALQAKILEVGGVRLRSQQVKVEGIKEMSDHANDQLTRAEVGCHKAEKDLAKLERAIASNEEALEILQEEVAALDKTHREKRAGLDVIRREVEKAVAFLEEKSEELGELKALLDEKQADMNKFRLRETQLEQDLEKAKRKLSENDGLLKDVVRKLQKLELHEIEEDDDDENEAADVDAEPKPIEELATFSEQDLEAFNVDELKATIAYLEEEIGKATPNMAVLKEYKKREKEFLKRALALEQITLARDTAKKQCDDLRQQRLDEFMAGFKIISMRLKETYQLITMGGNAELELVDSMDPFNEGILFSVMPPKKSWKNISNLSGGEKTLSSLAMIFALHQFRSTPLYFMDEIDAALDWRNTSIISQMLKQRTKTAQFIIISLRSQMFEASSRLTGVYKTKNMTKTISIDNTDISSIAATS